MTFLLSDGKLSSSPKVSHSEPKTLREIVDRYLAALSHGSVEANSLETFRMHLNHVLRKFGNKFIVQNLVAADLQDYLETRVRRKGKKSIPLSCVTLQKELASFRACFNWAVLTGLLTYVFTVKSKEYYLHP